MLYHLLEAINNSLRFDLEDEISGTNDMHWGVTPIPDSIDLPLPYITLYPSKLQLNQPLQQQPLVQTDSSSSLIFTQDFQQNFVLELYETTPSGLDKLSSLAMGSILTNHDSLINQYNAATESKPEYQTQQITTRHHLRQFQLHSGAPLYPKTGIGLQLIFTAIGHIEMTRTLTSESAVIQVVNVSNLHLENH